MSIEEMEAKVKGLNQELFNLRFQKATGQLANSAMIPKTKKDLARAKTILRERVLSDKGRG
jgi:large subunit ribosomal protein L29